MQPGRTSPSEFADSDDRPTVPAPIADQPTRPVVLAVPEPTSQLFSMQAPAGTHAQRYGAGHAFAIELLPGLVWSCANEDAFDFLGPQWFAYTGIPAEEQLGRSFSELLHPNDQERARLAFHAATASAGALELDVRVRRHDGVFRWFRVRGKSQRIGSERARLCGTCTDVEDLYQSKQDIRVLTQALAARVTERSAQVMRETTRREKAQSDLLRVSAHLAAITHAAHVVPWEWEVTDARVAWDTALLDLYGIERARFTASHVAWQRCLHPDDGLRAEQDLLRALSHVADNDFESSFRVIGDDGAVRHIRSCARVERDAQGNVLRLLGANWDVTAQVSELALLDQNQRLVHSNHELEQFAYVTSHDLQEPLRAVAGCAQLLQKRYRGKLDADADEIVDHLVDGAARMRTLIQDILALSRIQSQRDPFTEMSSDHALAVALENLSAAIAESAASITHDPLPMVRGDASQLALLFQNLIGNAIKYRSHQPPQIHISADAVSFRVRDNGIGIEPQYFEHIFGAFQRLHSRTAHPGTGIGLAICKKIVERHAGRIWVESAPGAGSSFCFTLGPAAHGGDPQPAATR